MSQTPEEQSYQTDFAERLKTVYDEINGTVDELFEEYAPTVVHEAIEDGSAQGTCESLAVPLDGTVIDIARKHIIMADGFGTETTIVTPGKNGAPGVYVELGANDTVSASFKGQEPDRVLNESQTFTCLRIAASRLKRAHIANQPAVALVKVDHE